MLPALIALLLFARGSPMRRHLNHSGADTCCTLTLETQSFSVPLGYQQYFVLHASAAPHSPRRGIKLPRSDI